MSSNIIQTGVMQWKYTSCEFNIEGRSGFSTFSMSDGLTAEDKDDLIKFAGGYNTPDGLPPQPVTEAELDLFPIIFSSFQLCSGKRVICRTRYVGKDYAGQRFGNLFSHALILPERTAWNFYPIQLWDNTRYSLLWADGLTEEEQHLGHMPEPLPLVDITKEQLRYFNSDCLDLLDNEERFEWFKSLLASVRDAKSNKGIILREIPDEIAKWIAAVQLTLPIFASQEISFSTYCRSANTAQQFNIAGTCLDGHSFHFGSPNLAMQFFQFDIVAGTVDIHDNANCRFAKLLLRYEHPSEELQRRYEFAKKYNIVINPFDNSLDSLLLLYDFFVQPSSPLDNAEWSTMWKTYQTLPRQTQQQILTDAAGENDFFILRGDTVSINRWGSKPQERLKVAVPFFERLIYNSPIKSAFTSWVLQQFNDNRKSREFCSMFANLQHKAEYTAIWLQNNNTQDKELFNLFFKIICSLPQESQGQLIKIFDNFIIRQFLSPLSVTEQLQKSHSTDIDNQKKISIYEVEKLFCADEKWKQFGKQLLKFSVKQLKPETLMFHFYLLLAIQDEELIEEHFKYIRRVICGLERTQIKVFYESVLPTAISRADSPQKHARLINLFPDSEQQIDFNEFASYYISIITQETRNWINGEDAKPQATAFLQYVFSQKLIFNRWISINDVHNGQVIPFQSQFVSLFWIPRNKEGYVECSATRIGESNKSRQDKSNQCKAYRNKIANVLKKTDANAEMKRVFYSRIGLIILNRTWWKNPYIVIVISVILTVVVISIVLTLVFLRKSKPETNTQEPPKQTAPDSQQESVAPDAKQENPHAPSTQPKPADTPKPLPKQENPHAQSTQPKPADTSNTTVPNEQKPVTTSEQEQPKNTNH
ncbi:MAG: hypothetical protein LBE12_05910 [Planctomycetaceae bacterium]|jgi:hypothetical protein|nr:hypothetical protein [Planctomycetaceae bacterium]